MRIRPENHKQVIEERLKYWHNVANNGPTMLHRQRGRHNLYQLVMKYRDIANGLGISTPPSATSGLKQKRKKKAKK